DFHVTGVQTCALPISGEGGEGGQVGGGGAGQEGGAARDGLDAVDVPAAARDLGGGRDGHVADLPGGAECPALDVAARDDARTDRSEGRRVGKERRGRW